MALQTRRLRTTPVDFENLEDRRLLAVFGTPWPDPREITVSFPADGVQVGTYTNNLSQTLDQLAGRQQWQELALRALQTWSLYADINVALRNDHDLNFGTSGMAQGDPRFGDVRMGAFPQSGVLANSLPFQAVAGSYSGDILLNSNQRFSYHDWSGGIGPDTTAGHPDDRDLFSLLLHETGNTLGLIDSTLDWTVMFQQYTTPKGVLTQEDINNIQMLYGARTDPYEPSDNGQMQVATLIPTPVGTQPASDVISIRSSLATAGDIDHFTVIPIANQDAMVIRLRAAGISLLNARVEVLDEFGGVLASGQANSIFSNDISLPLSGLQNHSALYVKVAATDSGDVYAVGDYVIELDYRDAATRAADPTPSSYDSGPDAVFANFALNDPQQGNNETPGTADVMDDAIGMAGYAYSVASSVASASDVDHWKVTAPATVTDRLLLTVAGVGLNSPDVRIAVVDASGQAVGAAGRLRPDGSWALEVAQPQANHDYYLQVSVDPSSTVGVGNYVATAEFVTPHSQMHAMGAGSVDSSMDDFVRWTAGKTRLYRFDLTAQTAAANDGVKLTIYDAHTQEVRMVIATPAGVTRTALAWLPQGDYILRFDAIGRSGPAIGTVQYALTCDGISDDQDESPIDADTGDGYDPYSYYEDPPTDPYAYYEYENWYQYYYSSYP